MKGGCPINLLPHVLAAPTSLQEGENIEHETNYIGYCDYCDFDAGCGAGVSSAFPFPCPHCPCGSCYCCPRPFPHFHCAASYLDGTVLVEERIQQIVFVRGEDAADSLAFTFYEPGSYHIGFC